MVSFPIKVTICVVLFIGGIAIFAKAEVLSEVLKKFYSQYPIVKYAGNEQLITVPFFLECLE